MRLSESVGAAGGLGHCHEAPENDASEVRTTRWPSHTEPATELTLTRSNLKPHRHHLRRRPSSFIDTDYHRYAVDNVHLLDLAENEIN